MNILFGMWSLFTQQLSIHSTTGSFSDKTGWGYVCIACSVRIAEWTSHSVSTHSNLQRKCQEEKDIDPRRLDGLDDHDVDKTAQWDRRQAHSSSEELKVVGGILAQREKGQAWKRVLREGQERNQRSIHLSLTAQQKIVGNAHGVLFVNLKQVTKKGCRPLVKQWLRDARYFEMLWDSLSVWG